MTDPAGAVVFDFVSSTISYIILNQGRNMLSLSNLPVAETLQQFKDRGINVGFIVPTDTGLEKSIMDAHDSLRRFLASQRVHDYAEQEQGTANKRSVSTVLFSMGETVDTETSLYRPDSKQGDPRIWVYQLKKYAQAGDLLAVAVSEGGLVVINCSKSDLGVLLSSRCELLTHLFPVKRPDLSGVAQDLLSKLSDISSRGYVPSQRRGDTGIGFTLESLLGIEANSSKKPDYHGIELKSGRSSTQSNRQATVFSQVPNWALSNLKGSKDIVAKHGRYSEKKGRVQVFHEISCIKPNSYDLQLELADGDTKLEQVSYKTIGENRVKDRDVVWLMDKLVSRVEEKHQETMWITADSRGKKSSGEEFWYRHVKHTKGVDPVALPTLLEAGYMTVHYLIKQLPSGAAKDQGYLFKMAPRYVPLLFNETTNYELGEL